MRILNGSQRMIKQWMRVLAAAFSLRDCEPFTLSTLVMQCWKDYPPDFGLEGLELEHPCSARVRNCLYGTRGLINMGYLRGIKRGAHERTEPRYALTFDGRMIAHKMLKEHDFGGRYTGYGT